MASAITHFIVGAALGLPARFDGVLPRWAVPVTCGLLGAAPDLDTPLMFALDLPRASVFAHRGFFHSPFFLALLCGALAAAATRGRSWGALAALWTACAITHPLLDMLTDGGSGVMLLFPFSEARLFFSWRPIRVSPLAIAGFFDRAAEILRSEAPFDAGAVAIALAAAWMKSASRRARGLS
jgi:inner membrane protein